MEFLSVVQQQQASHAALQKTRLLNGDSVSPECHELDLLTIKLISWSDVRPVDDGPTETSPNHSICDVPSRPPVWIKWQV